MNIVVSTSGVLTLHHWRGGWWQWRTSRWTEVEQRAQAAIAYTFTEHAIYPSGATYKKWAPNRHKVANLLDALAAVVHLGEEVPMPAWLDGRPYDGLLVSTANGLLDVGRRELVEHTPEFWNATSVPFDYDACAPNPARWLSFMRDSNEVALVAAFAAAARASPPGSWGRSSGTRTSQDRPSPA